MPKIAIGSVKPGMKLSKPVLNEAGMILLGEGTVLTGAHIDRLINMDIAGISIEGSSRPDKPMEEMLAELDARFRKVENEPHMDVLKKLFIEHIRELYK